jgi:hypothetical protein
MKKSEIEELIYKNYDWSKVNYEMTKLYIPPIKYGKVIKVIEGDIIIIGTKLAYIDDSLEETNIYRFVIYLDGILSPKYNSHSQSHLSLNKDDAKQSKDELSKFIYGRIVELRSLTIDKYGHLYAIVYLGSININEWMLEHNYAIKHKRMPKRRASGSDDILYDSDKYTEIKNNFLNDNNFIEDIRKSLLPDIKINSNNNLIKKTDCFLSHNWGDNKSNHNKISIINKALQKRGLITWFDENDMEGNIRYKMAEGIDNTSCVIVFITKQYRDKVNGIDMKDNCKYEFTYAVNQLGSHNMIPVVMEKEMCNTYDWKGELGAALSGMLYIDFIEENLKNEEDVQKKYDELYNMIKNIIKK